MKVLDMHLQRFMIKSIFLISLLISSQIIAMEQPNQQQGPQEPQVQLTDAQIDQIVQEADQAVQAAAITDEEMNRFNDEIAVLLDELDRQDPRPLGEFQNKVLFEISVGNAYQVVEGGYHQYGPDRWEDAHVEPDEVIPAHWEEAHWDHDRWEDGHWVDEDRYIPAHVDENGQRVLGRWEPPHWENGRHIPGRGFVERHFVEEQRIPGRRVEGRYVRGEERFIPRTEKMVQPVIQATGNHLLQTVFMAARCGLDYSFFKQLKKYYFQSVLSDWGAKTQSLLEALLCIEQDEEGEFLWDDNAQSLVQDAFIATFTPDDTTNTKIWMLLGLYAFASEICRTAQQKTLTMPYSGLIDFATRQARSMQQSSADGKFNIPIFGSILYLVDSWALGGESVVADNLPLVRNWTLRFVGWHHKALESYWFEIAKKSVVLARFLRQTKSYFETRTKMHVQENKEKLCALISCLSKSRNENDPELQKKIEEQLKVFIMQAYDYPFFSWVRFKGNCLFWTTIWVELLLMSPALVQGGKMIYEYLRP